MAELDITNAFNDCVDHLAQGQSLEDCLRRYPQYATSLRPMLEAGLLVQRINVQPADVREAQTRVRRRFEDALRAPLPKRTSNISRFVYALVAILIIAFISVGSLTAVSQNSLPGDALYSVKTFSEGLQKSLLDNDILEANFNQRRIQEIQQLLSLGRSEEVTFSGVIKVQNGTDWTIDSLVVSVQPEIPNATLAHVGDKVTVIGHTTEAHTLVATAIQIIQPVATPLPTVVIPTQTVLATLTATPNVTPTYTATQPVPTQTPIATAQVPTVLPQPTSLTPTVCAQPQPDGWVAYQIQSGDTLSALAANTGITLTELMRVNCITDAGRIVVGETIYLPRLPVNAPLATVNANQGSGGDNSGSNNSGTGNSNPPNPTDDHGGGSNSGPGGGGGDDGSGSGGGGHDDGSGHG